MSKYSRKNEMAVLCDVCGVEMGLHGARPPHTRGDECPGFKSNQATCPPWPDYDSSGARVRVKR